MITHPRPLGLSLIFALGLGAWIACSTGKTESRARTSTLDVPVAAGEVPAQPAADSGSEQAGAGGAFAAESSPACLEFGLVMCRRTFDCTPTSASIFLGVDTPADCPRYAASLCPQLELGAGGAGDAAGAPRAEQFSRCATALEGFDCARWDAGEIPSSCDSAHAGFH